MNYPFAVYDATSGIVLRIGADSDPSLIPAQAQSGQIADGSAPANVIADGLWQWTSGGYVHNAPPASVPPTPTQLGAYAQTTAATLIATPRSYTSGSTTLASDATSATLADWLALQQWANGNPSAITQWVANDGTVTALPASAVAPIALDVGGLTQSVYQTLATVLGQIAAGTTTTTAQIDSAAWPT